MSKSIEDRLMESHESERAMRQLFNAYTDPGAASLVNVLSSIQKAYGGDWMHLVNDVMMAMEMHDAGGFPVEWLDELEDDSLEAHSNASMGSTPRQP